MGTRLTVHRRVQYETSAELGGYPKFVEIFLTFSVFQKVGKYYRLNENKHSFTKLNHINVFLYANITPTSR